MLTYWETLIATRSNITVSDSYAQLWGKKLSNAYTVATYSGTLPATLRTVRGYLERYKIYGNTVQDGTPTPENPIVPSGCGARTENLYNWGTDIQYMFINSRGTIISREVSSANYVSEKIHVVAGKTYQLIRPMTVDGTGLHAAFYNENDAVLSVTALSLNSSYTLEAPTGASYFRTSLKRNDAENDISMFAEGSTPLPYEPYGYKLPMLSNSTVTNIYLGEVQTTRWIKKLVLTGEENWMKRTYGNPKHTFEHSIIFRIIKGLCSHYAGYTAAYIDRVDGVYLSNTSTIIITDLRFTAVTDFRDYLAAQYAAGTPVTIWYVLAEPETGIVNEPLMKIGDYVDTIDSTQSTVRIPTSAGSTTISWAGEGLAPSGIELVYKAKR